MNSLRKTITLAQISCRNISQSTALRESAKFQNLKKTQESLTVEDGVPVYIKAGLMDKMMYQMTLLLTAVGLGFVSHTLYSVSYPKKE